MAEKFDCLKAPKLSIKRLIRRKLVRKKSENVWHPSPETFLVHHGHDCLLSLYVYSFKYMYVKCLHHPPVTVDAFPQVVMKN